MSTAYELEGRTAQKQRTRAALVDAARAQVAQGLSPTVEDAAAAASISRATAYRYFPNQGALLAAAHPETTQRSMLPADAPDDPAARLDLVLQAFMAVIVETEAQQRTMLRLSLEADLTGPANLPLRQGRAIAWFHEALAPLQGQVDDATLRQLALAIRSATGIEALVWLTDIGGLSRSDAVDLMCWSAQSMLAATLAGQPPPAS